MKNFVNTVCLLLIVSVSSFAQQDSSKCANFKASIKNIINQSGGINVESNGEIDLHIVGGTKPYSISILNTTPKDPFANWNSGNSLGNGGGPVVCNFPIPCDTIAKGLPVGTYTFYISDSRGCSASLDAKIGKTNVIDCSKLYVKVDKLINPFIDNNNGKITVSAKGGGYPYHYKWSNGFITNEIDNLFQGNYAVIVTDTNNCQTTLNIELKNDTTKSCQTLSVEYVNIVNPVINNGTIEIAVNGGKPPYKIDWYYNFQFLNNNNQTKLENLNVGYYEIDITDSYNCKRKMITTLEKDTTLCKDFDVKILKIKNQDYNYYVNNGSVEFEFIGGKFPITNNLNTGIQVSQNKIINLAPSDNYTVMFTDANQCNKSVFFSITVDSSLCENFKVDFGNTKFIEDSIFHKYKSVSYQATGGLEPYKYSWYSYPNGVSKENNIIEIPLELNSIEFFFSVEDSNGCLITLNKSFQFDSTICSTLKVDFDANLTTSISDFSSCTGILALNIDSEFAGVDILWSNYSRESKMEHVCPGTYSVVVMDSNNCIKTLSKTISEVIKTTSLTSLTDKKINMFPNPCYDKLFVQFETNSGELEIIDLVGNQLIKQTYTNQSNLSVDASILKSGTYILRLKNELETSTHIFEKY